MGLLDILNGMQNGPRGPAGPSSDDGKSGGMSPMTMAILAVLAYKALKHFGGSSEAAPAGGGTAAPQMPAPSRTSAPGGGLGDLLKGSLGGLLAGGAAGSILSGGLSDLLKQMQQSGQGETANSWVGNGENKPIAPDDLANALGADQINTLTAHTGLSREQLLAELSQHLPDAVSQFTPDGHVPSEHDLSRFL